MPQRTLTAAGIVVALATPCLAGDKAASRPDAQAIQGEWRVVSAETDGKALGPQFFKGQTWTYDGKTFTVRVNGKVIASVPYTLDATKRPRQLDVDRKGEREPAIYDLSGDRLTVCAPSASRGPYTRPREFKTGAGMGTIMTRLERVRR
jgi:uncharacterized protein (TIGR03067 family)